MIIYHSITLALLFLSVADSKLIRSKQQKSLKAQPTLQNMPKISKERGDPNISRPGETGMPKQVKCQFGKCDSDEQFNFCYEWKNNELTCNAKKFGGANGQSYYTDPIAAASSSAVTIAADTNCAFYHYGKKKKVPLPGPAVPFEGNVVYVRECHESTPTWVDVTDTFATDVMNGCSMLAKYEGGSWKVAHMASKAVFTAMDDPAAKVAFPQTTGFPNAYPETEGRSFWVWGKVNAGKLEMYFGQVQAPLQDFAAKGLGTGPDPDTVYTGLSITSFASCNKVTFDQ